MRALHAFLVASVIVLVAATPAWAKHHRRANPLAVKTAAAIVATWQCQDLLHPEQSVYSRRSRARDPWKPHSPGYRRAELNRWQLRRAQCGASLAAREAVLRRLEAGLAGTPMAGSGRALEAAGRRWDVNPALIAGIAGTESTFGEAACSNNHYNAFGLASCGSWGGTPVPAFASWGDAYDFEARYLTGHTNITSGWPDATSTYLSGYAACTACWAATTAGHMQRFGLGTGFRYPSPYRELLLL